jgi:hypothetical protein
VKKRLKRNEDTWENVGYVCYFSYDKWLHKCVHMLNLFKLYTLGQFIMCLLYLNYNNKINRKHSHG